MQELDVTVCMKVLCNLGHSFQMWIDIAVMGPAHVDIFAQALQALDEL